MMQELNYIRCGDYYIPDIRLPEETRPIGRWGRMHRDYIKEHLNETAYHFAFSKVVSCSTSDQLEQKCFIIVRCQSY